MRAYDAAFMEQALILAEHGRGRTSPNPLVGALIVDEGDGNGGHPVVLAGGYHARLGAEHAEVAALQKLGGKAIGKTLYVTLEPCNHVGRTGKCTEAILAAGLRRVVVGMPDPNPRVAGGGIERLRSAGLEVEVGPLAVRCGQLNRGYLRWLSSGRPHLLMKAAVSLDGRLALRGPSASGGSRAPQWLTSAAAREHAHLLRDHSDAILVGAGTVEADDPLLSVRLPAEKKRDEHQPLRVVLDGALRTSAVARLCGPGTLILSSDSACREKKEHAAELRRRGVELLALPPAPGAASETELDLPMVLKTLGERGLLYVMCEGGARLHGAFLAAGLYDEAALFLAPLFLGEQGLPVATGLMVDHLAHSPWLEAAEITPLPPDVLLRGSLRYRGFAPREGL